MPQRRWFLMLLVVVVGCNDANPAPRSADSPAAPPSSNFDPRGAGSISGRVIWHGEIPRVPPFEVRANLPANHPGKPRQQFDHPHSLRIDPTSRGVGGAVIFLKGIDPAKANNWTHASVRVEVHDQRIVIQQGDYQGNTGFVHQGDNLDLVSRDPSLQALRATGAAFFTLTFPEPNQLRRRRLKEPGVVELSSGVGQYWMRGHVFVADHPYYTRTDKEGRFRLTHVPAGDYQLVCWLPSWREAQRDLDPETGLISRLYFQPPVESRQPVAIVPGGTAEHEFSLNLGLFSVKETRDRQDATQVVVP